MAATVARRLAELASAIARSRSHNEIVSVAYVGDIHQLRIDLASIYQHEIDDARENDGSIDVWGYESTSPPGDMDWRLCVRLVDVDGD